MSVFPAEYWLPNRDGSEAGGLDALLSPRGLRAEEPPQSADLTFLDTFDGLLFDAGKVFQIEQTFGGSVDWVLRDFRGRSSDHRVASGSKALPGFAREISAESLRHDVSSRIGARALLPCAKVRRKRYSLRSRDEDEPLPTEVRLDVYQLLEKGKASSRLPCRLVIMPREPPDKQARRALEHWAETLHLQPVEQDLWLDVLTATGRATGPGFRVDPPDLTLGMRADLAAKRILRVQLATMNAQEEGLKANLDAEFLHDFRVAIRRSRSILDQLKGLFPERTIAGFQRDLSWLGAITSPVRDLDVYLLEFPQLESALPQFMRSDLAPLNNLLQRHAVSAHRELIRNLASARYRRFVARWQLFLERPVPRNPTAFRAMEPFDLVAGRRIWKLYRRVVEEGRLLGEHTPGPAIHELRKRCKRIRYLTEFVAPVKGAEFMKKPIKDLKILQNHLGAFQDAEVQIARLRGWSAELAGTPGLPATTLLAIGALIGYFDQCQRKRRTSLLPAMEQFGRKETRERFRRLVEDEE